GRDHRYSSNENLGGRRTRSSWLRHRLRFWTATWPTDVGPEEQTQICLRAPALGHRDGRYRCWSAIGGFGHQERDKRTDLGITRRTAPTPEGFAVHLPLHARRAIRA